MKPYLSVIVPLYNEEPRVSKIDHVVDYLSTLMFESELILVDDGSTDKTENIIRKYQSRGVKIITYKPNMGKGYAIRSGMLMAQGDYRIFLDVDLSTPIEELENFIPYLKKFDCIIGTRKAHGAKVSLHQTWLRENLGKGFTFLSQLILSTPISDFTCGFKCFSANCAESVFSIAKIDRWGFDSEALFLCKKLHFSVKEVPVRWTNDARSRVKFPDDILRSLSDLATIRYNDLKGVYTTKTNK